MKEIKELKVNLQDVEFTTRIRQIGDSKFILIKKEFVEKGNLEVGEEVDVCVFKKSKIVQNYVCKLCSHQFDSDDNEPYCPICEAEGTDLKLVLNDYKELKGGRE